MSELQATIEFSLELCKFYNVDLFQRGYYQVRCGLRVPPKLPVQIEVSTPDSNKSVSGTASVLGNGGACRPFQILYRNEEVTLQDMILFRCHMLVDGRRLKESLERAEYSLVVELWFSEQPISAMVMVSTRTLQLNFSPLQGLHYHLPVLFDYFHLSAVSITIHVTLLALHQPYIKKSILHYVQSCTPRSTKPWLATSKIKSGYRDPSSNSLESVFSTSTRCGGGGLGGGVAARLAQARALHRSVCEALLEAGHNLQQQHKELMPLIGSHWRQQCRSVQQRLNKLCDTSKMLDIEEDFTAKANSDVAQLCAENIVLWQNFLQSVTCKEAVQQYLAKKHHSLRVKRFAEAFFVVDNPRHSAAGCYDANYQNYLTITELARRSIYLASLPPLPVHCPALDGDLSTMPIIFEDQYQDTLEFARRRSGAASKKSGSDPFLSHNAPEPQMPTAMSHAVISEKDDCSCGINAILESRSQSRTGMVNCNAHHMVQGVAIHGTINITPNSKLTTRLHSKSLDQLKAGNFATMPYRSTKHEERKKKQPKDLTVLNQINGCFNNLYHGTLPVRHTNGNGTRKFAYASRSTVDLARNENLGLQRDEKWDNMQNTRYEYQVPRPLSEPQSKISQQYHFRPHKDEKYIIYMKSRNPQLTSSSSIKCINSSEVDKDFPRSNSTQIFPPVRQEELMFHRSTLILSRKENTLPNYKDDSNRRSRRMSTGCRKEYQNDNGVINTLPKYQPHKVKTNYSKEETSCNKNSSTRYKLSREIVANSSSTDSDSVQTSSKKIQTSASVPHHLAHTGDRLRHVRSASSVLDEMYPFPSAASESLPNLMGKIPNTLSLSTSASTSSLTSEQSGWVSSGNSSGISSPDVPLSITQEETITMNGEHLRTKLFELISPQLSRENNQLSQEKPNRKSKSKSTSKKVPNEPKSSLPNPISDPLDPILQKPNGVTSSPNIEHPYIKKEFAIVTIENETKDIPYEELRLPPPKQFRDVPPPEPFRDPSPGPGPVSGPGPSPAIDNLLYHVYESIQDDMKKSKSNTDLADKIEDFLATEEIQPKLPTDEAHQVFQKAREEFKSQLKFSGMLYSDLTQFASNLPYFHISDEYRIFSPEGMHLIICVHGLDGNSADLRLVKTYLELGLPGAHLEFLMSERNQGDTFSDFDTMTDRLVAEILYHVESCGMRPSRISFVGHSLGNIIIRSALTRPQMKPLLSRLHTFLSLSGPHLGTLYNSSGLVNMGMWFMQKWKKSGSLLQLCLRDASDVRQSFLYRLSQRSTLHHFKNVLLCGSSQDRYVPLHSARLELCKSAIRDTTALGSGYREMVHNVVSPMLAKKDLTLVRYDVHHALPHTANALIGRAAHIAVLDSELFIEKFLVVVGLKYFR